MFRPDGHVMKGAGRRIKAWLEDDRGQSRRLYKMLDRGTDANGLVISARGLECEQQLEIIFRLYDQERLPLAFGSVAERIFVFEVDAKVRLICDKAFDLVAAQIVGGDGSIEVVHELG